MVYVLYIFFVYLFWWAKFYYCLVFEIVLKYVFEAFNRLRFHYRFQKLVPIFLCMLGAGKKYYCWQILSTILYHPCRQTLITATTKTNILHSKSPLQVGNKCVNNLVRSYSVEVPTEFMMTGLLTCMLHILWRICSPLQLPFWHLLSWCETPPSQDLEHEDHSDHSDHGDHPLALMSTSWSWDDSSCGRGITHVVVSLKLWYYITL